MERLLSFNGDIETEYDRSFQVDVQSFDHVFTCDLKPLGSRIQLNNENRSEFVGLYADFVLSKSVENQFNAFKEGFQLVCQDSAIKVTRDMCVLYCLLSLTRRIRFSDLKKWSSSFAEARTWILML